MRPFDPRLVRYARSARGLLALTAGLGVAATALIIAQAGLLARALATAAAGTGAGVLGGTLAALLLVVTARTAVSYASETAALRSAVRVKSELRRRLTAHAIRLGPGWLGRQRAGEVTTLATRGLDSLDTYFARYLPQVVLACLVPLAVLARIAAADWLSAVVIGVTLPLVPVFAVLVGLHTRARTARQWRLLARLGGHFLDVVEGLPTLKIFRQGKRQAEIIGTVTEEHRRVTMATLRQAFLSALVLDLAATLATALVAVEVGLRLLAGRIGYQPAMLILLLTPEAYLPLRTVGTAYHASMEGAAAGGEVFEILSTIPGAAAGTDAVGAAPRVDLRRAAIELTSVTVGYQGRARPALDELSLRIEPGEKIMIAGPSGAGKSSLLALLLRFADAASGSVRAGGVELAALDVRDWRCQLAWVPQHPYLFSGTVRDNIALGQPDASPAAVGAAASMAGADQFVTELPAGYDTQLGERGLQLSAGQRQRLALARAFLRDAPLVLLDEPTAHLDATSAAAVRAAVHTLLADRTVIVVSHDDSWSSWATRRLELHEGQLQPPAAERLTMRPDGGRPEGCPALGPPALAPTALAPPALALTALASAELASAELASAELASAELTSTALGPTAGAPTAAGPSAGRQ
jgi:ATP-binding cassette subfamily C protein CydD